MTLHQLSHSMTAHEFAQHIALEREECLPAAWQRMGAEIMSALANGPLVQPQKRLWAAHDFMPTLWADVTDPNQACGADAESKLESLTVEQIMARARMAGMVH